MYAIKTYRNCYIYICVSPVTFDYIRFISLVLGIPGSSVFIMRIEDIFMKLKVEITYTGKEQRRIIKGSYAIICKSLLIKFRT